MGQNACIKPAVAKDEQNPSMEVEGGGCEVPSNWGDIGNWRLLGESQFSLEVSPLVGQLCSRAHNTPKSIWTAQIELSREEENKRVGVWVWREGDGYIWDEVKDEGNMVKLYCLNFSKNTFRKEEEDEHTASQHQSFQGFEFLLFRGLSPRAPLLENNE